MIIVRRANVVLDIDETEKDRYVAMGYEVLDEQGNIIQATMPRDVSSLQKAYIDHLAEIDSLKATIQSLKAKLNEKPAKTETAQKPVKKTKA